MIELKPGDMAIFKQSDGNQLMIIVREDCVIVKAQTVFTDLKIKELNNYSVSAIAVDRK